MIFVTGATGILGRIIVLELLKKGFSVRAAKRASSDLEEVRHSYQFYTENHEQYFNKIDWVTVDFEDLESIENALKDVSEVYHCAAKVGFHPKDSKEIYKTNIQTTKNILYACENSSVKKFLHVSSIAVLDVPNEAGELDELSDFNPKISHSTYALSKHLSEMEVWRASAEGLPVIIINPGMIIGSGNWGNSSGDIFPQFERSSFTFSGSANYVDVRDVAQIAIQLMEKETFGESFILVSEQKKYEWTGNKIRAALGLSSVKIVPQWLLDIARWISVFLGWLIPPLQMANRCNIEAVTSDTRISSQKIKKTLGNTFIPVAESIDFHLKNYMVDKKIKNRV